MSPGFHFFSAGRAWAHAYRRAVRFLEDYDEGSERVLVLGPAVGDGGAAWIRQEIFRGNPLIFGARIVPWREFVRNLARAEAVRRGEGFREFQLASRREYLRRLLSHLSQAGVFHHLQDLWQEEKFFAALLETVDELRRAGLGRGEDLERAQAALSAGDAVYRNAYEDLWHLLQAWDRLLPTLGGGRHDEASLLSLAATVPNDPATCAPREIFLLGFATGSLLEAELLQALARSSGVHVPVFASTEELEEARKGKDPGVRESLIFLRALLTAFAGRVQWEKGGDEASSRVLPLLEGHTPVMEARAAGALVRLARRADGESVRDRWRVVIPRGHWESPQVEAAFFEQVGLAPGAVRRSPLDCGTGRWIYHALRLGPENYSLESGSDFARLLSFTTSRRYSGVPTQAMRAGIRRGLREWKEKLFDGELARDFLERMERVSRAFPEKASASGFEEAFREFVEITGLARLAQDVSESRLEREAHLVIASFLRNAAMLSASSDTPMEYASWLQEMEILLRGTSVEGAGGTPGWLSFHEPGEWLPPEENASTLVLGLNAGAEPSLSFTFYLEEEARRKLSGWLLRSRVGGEASFHGWSAALAALEGSTILSRPAHSMRGAEERASWVLGVLPVAPGKWPVVPLAASTPSLSVGAEFHAPGRPVPRVSASLINTGRHCLFKAYVQNLASVEDWSGAPELDVPKLQEGSLLHLSLKRYYEEKKGRTLKDSGERSRVLFECVQDAARGMQLEYYKGSGQLLDLQVRAMHRRLFRFVESDAEWMAEFSDLAETLCEVPIEGELVPGIPYKGSVDRVDRDPVRRRFLVSDYKLSTTPTSAEVKELKDLQLLFYMDALEKAEWSPAGATYINLRSLDRKQGMVLKEFNRSKKANGPVYYDFTRARALTEEDEFREVRARAREEILRIALEMKAGNFAALPIDPEECERCGVRAVCRIRERELPQALAPVGLDEAAFLRILNPEAPLSPQEKAPPRFSEEQAAVLGREEGFVFVEAAAGTGKTTVIVERFRRAVSSVMREEGIEAARAVERIRAISFTEKSARELSERVARALLPEFGSDVAARAVQGIGTIHGFCRQVLQDFPIESGVHPMFTILDEIKSREVRREVLEDFFLQPKEAERAALEILLAEFSRSALEQAVEDFLGRRALLEPDLERFLRGDCGELLFPEGVPGDLALRFLEVFRSVSSRYDGAKAKIPAVDFNDLERLALSALRNGKVRDWYRSRISLLMVDEFQDTNPLQREIVDLAAKPGRRNLFAVGDAKQSIYRFRAADVSVFQGLKEEAAREESLFPLSRNFRSQAHVVGFANHAGRRIFPGEGEEKEEFEADFQFSEASRPAGKKVSLLRYENPEERKARAEIEPELLVAAIRDQQAGGRQLHEIAVIFRRMAGNAGYLKALSRAGIPYVLGSSAGFWNLPLVTDSVALLRALYGDRNDLALLAVLRSPWCRWESGRIDGILLREGRSLWQKLGEEAPLFLQEIREQMKSESPSTILRRAWRHHPWRSQQRELLQMEMLVDVVEELESSGLAFGAVVDTLSENVAWGVSEGAAAQGAEIPEPSSAGAVQVLTVHASKGLEFPVVILPDLDGTPNVDRAAVRFHPGQGIALKTETQREEKSEDPAYREIYRRAKSRDGAESARLFYVAITRAKEHLVLLVEGKDPKESARRYDGSWGSWVRLHGPGDHAEWMSPGSLKEWRNGEAPRGSGAPPPELAQGISPPASLSISELAAFRTCGEFHRRKFVQAWDDRVVEAWPKPSNHFRSPRRSRGGEEEPLLRKLGLERKDRGIALHRVLERTESVDDLGEAATWLRDAYENQGAEGGSRELESLIRLDVSVIEKFLRSDAGRLLFGSRAKAEVPFVWKLNGVELHGAVDRLAELSPGRWVVADYKSSVSGDNLDRYGFQVNAYRGAIRAWLLGCGEKDPRVDGWLVDLFTAEAHDVPPAPAGELTETVAGAMANYTLPREAHDPVSRGVAGGEKCFVCPYSLHCAPGREFVLKS